MKTGEFIEKYAPSLLGEKTNDVQFVTDLDELMESHAIEFGKELKKNDMYVMPGTWHSGRVGELYTEWKEGNPNTNVSNKA